MSSCTGGIPRSSWIIALVTYQGASTIARNTLDWHLCMIAILDLQAQPHNSIPSVHIGVIRDLYSNSAYVAHLATAPQHIPTHNAHLDTAPHYIPTHNAHIATVPQHIPTHNAHLATVPQHIPTHNSHLATAPQHIPTQHDMLLQHLVCKYELNCE